MGIKKYKKCYRDKKFVQQCVVMTRKVARDNLTIPGNKQKAHDLRLMQMSDRQITRYVKKVLKEKP